MAPAVKNLVKHSGFISVTDSNVDTVIATFTRQSPFLYMPLPFQYYSIKDRLVSFDDIILFTDSSGVCETINNMVVVKPMYNNKKTINSTLSAYMGTKPDKYTF